MTKIDSPVSVIIPAFNAGAVIEKCLAALASQTCPALEILVIDDGSTDGTGARAEPWARVVRHEAPHGPGAARNTGARLAKGEVLAFIDSDCVPPPDWLEKILAALADQTVGAAGGGYIAGADQGFWQEFCCKELMFRRRHRRGEVSTLVSNNMACRKDAFFEAGGFPEAFPVGEDMVLSHNISLRHKVLWLEDNGVAHHFKNSLKEFLAHQFFFGAESTRLFLLNPQLMAAGNHQTKSLHAVILTALMALMALGGSAGCALLQYPAAGRGLGLVSMGLLLVHAVLYMPFIRFLRRQGFRGLRQAYAVSFLRDLCAGLAIFEGVRRTFIKKNRE